MLGTRTGVMLASLLAVMLAAPAGASFSGSNGQVAWVGMDGGLYIDDPWDDQPAGAPVAQADDPSAPPYAGAPVSSPQWSPDGTRLVYTEPVADTDPFPDHSAVFVINADGTGRRQLSHPYPGRLASCDTCEDQEVAWDFGPVWTPAGEVAFIRHVAAAEDAPHRSIYGTSVWTMDPDAGDETNIAWRDPESEGLFQSIVWPEASLQPYSIFVGPATDGFQLRAIDSGVVLATHSDGIVDFDASPDGKRLAYTTIAPGGGTIHVIERDGTQVESVDTGFFPAWVRFTPDGNALLVPGCANDRDGAQHCGWITQRLDDPDGDVRAAEPEKAPYLDANVAIQGPSQAGARSLLDIQGQDLPILFLPGFLGSEIECGGSTVWMPIGPPIDLAPIRLAPDGLGNASCPSAGPNGKAVGSFLGSDVYGHADDWLEAMDPKGGGATFGWDWRKRPQASLLALDDKIDEMIEGNDVGLLQGASRVSLVGHSYGGLLMRTYVDEPARAKKVARMLTVGSPFWGSPKPVFPLTFGVEAPGFGVLDTMIDNDDLKASFQNFAGAYHLLPSDSFGGWLSVAGALRDQAGVKALLESVGANGALAAEGRQTHVDHIDGFFDDGGRIDVRAVVGVGLLTPRTIDIVPDAGEGDADVVVRFGDGDETVPARSATQGPPGTADPLGDDIHIQRRCGIPHMGQTKDEVFQAAYADFLVSGRTPRRLPVPSCSPAGRLIEISEDVPIPPPAFAGVSARTSLAPATGPLGLGDAELAGLADVLSVPGGTQVVTNDSRPVSLTFRADGWTMTVTALEGEAEGRRLTYGPMSGDVVVAPGTGDVPEVSLDGQLLAPTSDSGADPDPDPGPGSGDSSGGSGAGAGQPPASQPGTSASRKLAASVRGGAAKVSRRGVVTLRLRGDAGTGTLVLKAKLGRRLTRLGRAKVRLRAPGSARVKVKLSKAALRALRSRRTLRATAVLTLRDAQGRTGSATAKVTLRR